MKKTMAMLLALLLVAVMLPVTAMADVVEVSDEAGLRMAVANGGEIKLTGDVTIAGEIIVVGDGQSVKIDLNGHTISRSFRPFDLTHGSLEFTGEGTVKENDNDGYSPVLIKDVTFAGWAPIFVDQNNQKAYGVVVNFNGKAVSPADESHTAYGCAAYINGQTQHKNNCPVINIGSTAELKSKDIGIYAAGYGIWNINGATITGDTGFYIKSGTVNITGSTIKGTGTQVDPVANGNGANSTGDAIIMDSKNGYAGNMILTLGAGNIITSTNGYALQVANTDAAGTHVTALNITGGNLTGNPDAVKLSQQFKDAVANENINASASITGGTFSGNTNDLKPYIPSNMEITESGNVVNKSITIIVPSEGGSTTTTPSTDNTKNPGTGANDFVGVAAALAVVSVLGAAVAVRKK